MKSISRHLTTLALVSGLTGSLFASNAAAQEQFAADLVLRKTYVKTATNPLFPDVSGGQTPLFTPTTVSCPNGGTCTLRVELSALLETRGNPIVALVLVDQQPTQAVPLPITAGVQIAPASFVWSVRDLEPGEHTVDVLVWRFFYTNDEPRVRLRTLTISVYKP